MTICHVVNIFIYFLRMDKIVTEVIEYRVRSKTMEKMCDDDNLKILFPNRTYSTDIIRTQYFIILSEKSLGDDTLNQNQSKVFMMIRRIRDVDQDVKKRDIIMLINCFSRSIFLTVSWTNRDKDKMIISMTIVIIVYFRFRVDDGLSMNVIIISDDLEKMSGRR